MRNVLAVLVAIGAATFALVGLAQGGSPVGALVLVAIGGWISYRLTHRRAKRQG